MLSGCHAQTVRMAPALTSTTVTDSTVTEPTVTEPTVTDPTMRTWKPLNPAHLVLHVNSFSTNQAVVAQHELGIHWNTSAFPCFLPSSLTLRCLLNKARLSLLPSVSEQHYKHPASFRGNVSGTSAPSEESLVLFRICNVFNADPEEATDLLVTVGAPPSPSTNTPLTICSSTKCSS